MGQQARITATFFTSLLTRLGVRPPFAEGYLLSNVVQPVTLVDSDIVIPTSITPIATSTPNSTGEQAAVAANTVLADSGALAAGTYFVRAWIANIATAANRSLSIQHRDSANAANIWEQRFYISATGVRTHQFELRETLNLNERIRVITISNMGAGELL